MSKCGKGAVYIKNIKIYSDGSCLSNPGPGGWCAILTYKNQEKVLSGGDAHTTNNKMELLAVISGLEALKEPCEAEVYTDSKYVADGISKGWAVKWRANNWVKGDKKPALNAELWSRLLDLTERHSVKFTWLKGHDGHEYNERCDAVANRVAQEYKERKEA